MDPLLIRIDEQQRQLKQQNSELAEAENMRRDFSSNVSHEMKTPLQVISGYAELMKNDMVQPSDRQKFAALIYDEAQAMRSLINDVLTLSKLDESAFGKEGASVIDLHGVAQRVAGRLSSFAADQNVSVSVEGGRACIAGSETLAEEMLYNLIENGIRYNHEGGSVTMSVGLEMVKAPRVSERTGRIESPSQRHAASEGQPLVQKQAVVRVTDTGPGIPEEMHDKIFERFFRVDQKPVQGDGRHRAWALPSSSTRSCHHWGNDHGGKRRRQGDYLCASVPGGIASKAAGGTLKGLAPRRGSRTDPRAGRTRMRAVPRSRRLPSQ